MLDESRAYWAAERATHQKNSPNPIYVQQAHTYLSRTCNKLAHLHRNCEAETEASTHLNPIAQHKLAPGCNAVQQDP